MLTAHALRYVRDGQVILAGVDVSVGAGERLAVEGVAAIDLDIHEVDLITTRPRSQLRHLAATQASK